MRRLEVLLAFDDALAEGFIHEHPGLDPGDRTARGLPRDAPPAGDDGELGALRRPPEGPDWEPGLAKTRRAVELLLGRNVS